MAAAGEGVAPIRTSLGEATPERVQIMGLDLAEEVIGRLDFVEVVGLLLLGRRPVGAEGRMLSALLVALMDHGFTPSAVATRLIYHMAPDALQGAVAAGLLGAGSRHLGTAEYAARMLQEARAASPAAPEVETARRLVSGFRDRGERIPGIGHGTHVDRDPRADRLLAVAGETGTLGPHCRLLLAVQREAERRYGRRLPVNVTGAMGAIASDLGMPWQMGKSFALIGRTVGLLAHLREEIAGTAYDSLMGAIGAHIRYIPPGTGGDVS